MTSIHDRYKRQYSNNREVAMSTLSRTGKETNKHGKELPPNHPLRNKKFRQKVSIVLHDVFGLKFTIGNYKKIDEFYHWESLYQSIANPSFDARVYLLSDNKQIAPIGRVMDGAEYLRTRVSLPGATREIALENMDNRMYEFISWC